MKEKRLYEVMNIFMEQKNELQKKIKQYETYTGSSKGKKESHWACKCQNLKRYPTFNKAEPSINYHSYVNLPKEVVVI